MLTWAGIMYLTGADKVSKKKELPPAMEEIVDGGIQKDTPLPIEKYILAQKALKAEKGADTPIIEKTV